MLKREERPLSRTQEWSWRQRRKKRCSGGICSRTETATYQLATGDVQFCSERNGVCFRHFRIDYLFIHWTSWFICLDTFSKLPTNGFTADNRCLSNHVALDVTPALRILETNSASSKQRFLFLLFSYRSAVMGVFLSTCKLAFSKFWRAHYTSLCTIFSRTPPPPPLPLIYPNWFLLSLFFLVMAK